MANLLITPEYKELNQQLHASGIGYGRRGNKRAAPALKIAQRYGCTSILDYGCGKATMKPELIRLGFDGVVEEYDPCVPGKEGDPADCDLVVCTDVLEHIEPECLEAVLTHLRAKTLKRAWLLINLFPDMTKTLPDGSNPHKCILPSGEWFARLVEHFTAVRYLNPDRKHASFLASV